MTEEELKLNRRLLEEIRRKREGKISNIGGVASES